MKMKKTTPERIALTVPEFCRAVGIDARLFAKLEAEGTAPPVKRISPRKRLITTAAANEWLEARTAA
ncbi:MAG: hypothetical protein CMM42_00110 [Rhodospirillaceae bacterium]|nr:hypothetical protein [Rhodospirillaceae bacterium]MBB55605.1 hypothetical protein [Rhodospirillaceae bacterium]MBB55615.1 hypothetical protein [Rhodospirillaceae bacterium]|tara:strand:+ start:162 stop:362 length:201 start_codon:yes stop_codon:yes gene_type:complete